MIGITMQIRDLTLLVLYLEACSEWSFMSINFLDTNDDLKAPFLIVIYVN